MKIRIFKLVFLGLLLTSSIIIINNFNSLLLVNDNIENYNEINIKTAGFWNLTGNPITIDDLNPSTNWSYTASHYDWCSGSGTLLDPYLIENVIIGGQGSGNCIEILNSNVYFILKNCTVYNSGSFRTGIFLNNTNNGKIIDNDCVKHKNHGIYLYSSDNNIISGNTVNNNAITGIHLFLSNNNTLSGNTANNNTNDGIHLYLSDNNTLSGNTANNNTISGIHLFSSDNNTLSGNTANNNTNDGIHLYLSDNNMLSGNSANKTNVGIKLFFSNNTTLSGNTVNNNNVGIYLEGSNNTMLSGNKVNNNTNTGIYLFFSNNTTLSGNTANNNIYNGIYLWTSNDATLSENIVNNNTNYGFYLGNSNNTMLSGNTVNNTSYGIYLGNSNNAMLSGNMVNNTSYGIYLGNSNNAMLSGDIVNNNTNYGFYLENSNNATLSGNTVNNNNVGIILGDSNNTTLSGNIVNNNINYGIYLGMSNNVTFLGNTVNNNNVGIYLWTSNYTTLSENMVSNNTNIGISFMNSNNNIVSNNIIKNNKYRGISISGGITCVHNLFFKNYFINNTIHAQDNGMNNYWNNSVIGNYWDTYTGVDADKDGIGDTPYIFSGGTDYLPIVEITPPTIIVNFPNSKDVFGNIAPNFNVEIFGFILDTMWYSLNGGKNITFTTNGNIDQSEWEGLPDGNVSIFFYANDTLKNIGVFEVIIEKDTTSPNISILAPELNGEFGKTAPAFEILVEERNLDKMWYIVEGIDSMLFINNTIGTINQALWDSLPKGYITLKFYANDTVGNVNNVQVIIIKTVSPSNPQETPYIPGYNLFILIGAIIAVVLMVNKKKLISKF